MLGLNDVIGNDLADSFTSHRQHHHRRSLKTVIRVHRLTIVSQYYRQIHIGHLLSRMYPGAGDISSSLLTFKPDDLILVID